jgi:4-alpha-glucanotransferase
VGALPDGDLPVDFESVRAHKLPLLREAAVNFLHSAPDAARERYANFCRESDWWLEDYVLFSVLREKFGEQPWNTWPRDIARRDPETIRQLRSELQENSSRSAFCSSHFLSSGARCATTAPLAAFASSATCPSSSAMTVPMSGRIPNYFA